MAGRMAKAEDMVARMANRMGREISPGVGRMVVEAVVVDGPEEDVEKAAGHVSQHRVGRTGSRGVRCQVAKAAHQATHISRTSRQCRWICNFQKTIQHA